MTSAALDELGAFLLSGDVLRPMDRRSGLAQDLSLGGLLLVQDELHAGEALSSESRSVLKTLDERWEALLREQPAAIGRKASREQEMRLRLWSAYLSDLEDSTSEGEFAQQARQRVMLERLADLSSKPETMEPVDRRLRHRFQPGPFIWNPALEQVYPRDRYWFLYGRPSTRS